MAAAVSDDRYRVAVDIGGTFTDIALLTDDGLIHQSKISSTPADPSIAVIEGVGQLLAELSIAPGAIAEVLHGTTVGSNTILQRKGARTGLITTRGFRDVLEIGRIRMPDMFDLTWDKPKPLVPRRHRLEVAERMAADGSSVEPLSEASVITAGEAACGRGHRGGRHLPSSTATAIRRMNAAPRRSCARAFRNCWSPPPTPCCRRSRNTSAPAPRW